MEENKVCECGSLMQKVGPYGSEDLNSKDTLTLEYVCTNQNCEFKKKTVSEKLEIN